MAHITSGVFRAGSSFFLTSFLLPSLRLVGPAARPLMERLGGVRELPAYMMATGIPAILSGAGLYWRDSGGFQSAWIRSGPGITFDSGALLAIMAAAIGAGKSSPAAKRLGKPAAGAMAVARYVP